MISATRREMGLASTVAMLSCCKTRPASRTPQRSHKSDCLIDVVRDKERRNLLLIEDAREFLAKPGTRWGVERSERLVQEEDFGFEKQGHGRGWCAALLRRKGPQRARSARCEMRRRSSQGWTRAARPRRCHSAQLEAKFYVVAHCPPEQQRLLKHPPPSGGGIPAKTTS